MAETRLHTAHQLAEAFSNLLFENLQSLCPSPSPASLSLAHSLSQTSPLLLLPAGLPLPPSLPFPPSPVNFSLAHALAQSFSNVLSSVCSVSRKFRVSASFTRGLKMLMGRDQGSRYSGWCTSTSSSLVMMRVSMIFLAWKEEGGMSVKKVQVLRLVHLDVLSTYHGVCVCVDYNSSSEPA